MVGVGAPVGNAIQPGFTYEETGYWCASFSVPGPGFYRVYAAPFGGLAVTSKLRSSSRPEVCLFRWESLLSQALSSAKQPLLHMLRQLLVENRFAISCEIGFG